MDLAAVADPVAALRSWVHDATGEPLVVSTSGSTGRPKRVVLPRAAVLASAAASAARLGGAGPWVLAVPPTFVAGVNVVVRSLLAGHEPRPVEGLHDWMAQVGPLPAGEWFCSLVPTQVHRLLDPDVVPGGAALLASAHTVLIGGGPVDPALRERAAAAGLRMVATYGSAETCGGCVYDGASLDGVDVVIGAGGRVELAGPTLFERYEADPALTAQVLVDGRFRTSDAGELGPDGRLRVLGRLDDVVVSGGVNVPGPAVAARLRAHPEVRAAEVIGVPDPEWGHRLVAFVVGAAGEVDAAELRDWVAAAHPRAWAPRQVVSVPELPMLANGKPDRLALRALAQEHAT